MQQYMAQKSIRGHQFTAGRTSGPGGVFNRFCIFLDTLHGISIPY